MSRAERLSRQLAALEAAFVASLVADLKRVQSGVDAMYFIVEELAPEGYRVHWLSRNCAQRWEEAQEILRLREMLGLPHESTPAEIFRATVVRYAERRPHDLGPIRLAERILEVLRSPE